MTPPAWTCTPYDYAAALCLQEELGVRQPTAAVLVRRGYGDPAEARRFLAAEARTPARDLPGAQVACEVILRHVRAGSRILVFGDYDVDGVCSTAMMVRTLRSLGAEPLWELPDRADGYGLTPEAVGRVGARGVDLLVTVDCGVTSVAEVAHARSLGLDVVVTDHHRPAAQLPDCPVVHPALGPLGQGGPAGELCAAGVVLKLSEALRAASGLDPAGAEVDLDLAAMATVCDMVPLREENRRIAREGLRELADTRKEGLRALMRVADLEPGDVDASSVSFRLGPRINAAGRLQRADAALELLLTEDRERADEVARELDALNHDRRDTEQRILHEAEAACADQMSQAALVVAGQGWHPGVVGIVASRLVKRFHRPAVVIALDGDGGRGSGRSIGSYDLHAGLGAVADHLAGYGGHRMAAGLQIDADRVPGFRRALAAHAGARLAPTDLVPVERVDAVVPGSALDLATAEELSRLGPFGAGNPEPVLLVPAARVEHVTAMGEERQHARFSLVSGGTRARGVAFRRSQRSLAAAGAQPHDVSVGLERNRWNGAVEARVVMRELSPTPRGTVRELGCRDFWELVAEEQACDPAVWCAPRIAARTRELVDRCGQGFSGFAGDLLSSAAPALVIVADVARRRASLEGNVASMADSGSLSVCSWQALAAAPGLAEPFGHVIALDPPPSPALDDLQTCLPGSGFVHLAWGPAEIAFTQAHCRAHLGVRSSMAELWKALRSADELAGETLHRALTGDGAHPRDGALSGRVLRVLAELGLIDLDLEARRCRVGSTGRVELERSSSHRAYWQRLKEAEAHLGRLASREPVRTPARAA